MEIHLNMESETAAKLKGITSHRNGSEKQSPTGLASSTAASPSLNPSTTAKYCNECGVSLNESKRTLYMEWMAQNLEKNLAKWAGSSSPTG